MLFSTFDPNSKPNNDRPSTGISHSKSNNCKGNGGFLILSNSNTSSYLASSDYIPSEDILCTFHCQAKECPNYLFCKRKCPEWILQCNCGLCDNCSNIFGTRLTFITPSASSFSTATCQICHEKDTTLYIQYKHCSHYACRNCFSFSFSGTVYEYYDIENEPRFPYPKEIEEEYYNDDSDDQKWKNDLLIQKYLQEWNQWEEKREEYQQQYLEKHIIKSSSQQKKSDRKSSGSANKKIEKPEGKEIVDEEDSSALIGQCPICAK